MVLNYCTSRRKGNLTPLLFLRMAQRYQPGLDLSGRYKWPLFSFRTWYWSWVIFKLGRWQLWVGAAEFSGGGLGVGGLYPKQF